MLHVAITIQVETLFPYIFSYMQYPKEPFPQQRVNHQYVNHAHVPMSIIYTHVSMSIIKHSYVNHIHHVAPYFIFIISYSMQMDLCRTPAHMPTHVAMLKGMALMALECVSSITSSHSSSQAGEFKYPGLGPRDISSVF